MSSQIINRHSDGCVTRASDWSSPVVRLENVSMRYDRRKVLSEINLVVNYGDFVAVTGPNGGGKTTMLRVILGLLRPTSGSVMYFAPDGKSVDRLSIGYLPQKNKVDSQFPIVVRDVIASGLLAQKDMGKEVRMELVSKTIALMGLEQHYASPIGSLSGGQLQRALLGRAIISRPQLLVLDEPLSYIDKHFEARLYDIIREISSYTTIILVSHELSHIDHMANRHVLVDCRAHECHADHHFVMTDCDI